MCLCCSVDGAARQGGGGGGVNAAIEWSFIARRGRGREGGELLLSEFMRPTCAKRPKLQGHPLLGHA